MLHKKHRFYMILLVAVILLLPLFISACEMPSVGGGAGTPKPGEATAIPPVRSSGEVVSEGKVAPFEYAKLSFSKGGVIAEVLFKEGDKVQKGDLIARLEDSEQMKASVTQAEESVLLATQAIDDLKKNVDVEVANTFSKISSSYDATRESERQLYYFNLPVNQRKLDMFQSADQMQKKLEDARKSWDPFKYEDQQVGGNYTQRTKLKKDLDDAESDYRTSLLRISYASKAKSAQADLDKARKDYENLKNGPDPDKMAAAEAKLKNAQASLDAAKASLNDLELRASLAGTVAKMDAKVGENASPGVQLVTLADISHLIIETDNLTEIEVVKVSVGQPVSIVADALPDDTMEGNVTSIAEVFEEKRGDVTYTVKIDLKKVPEKLRWGMTVNCTFKAN
ncbi:MAG: efflux RND transporter periplasmic adaptor subunit [Chloroflexota bacterium]